VLPAWDDQLQQFLLRWHLPQRHDLLSDRPDLWHYMLPGWTDMLWHYVLPGWTGLPQRHYVLPD